MFDAFISYSRKDKEFVRTVHKALTDANKKIWVDWEDIPVTSDWRAEIQGGIDGSNSFIFVITPDSAASQICGEEIAHAVDNKKRLIPLVHHDVDPKLVNSALSSHNYLFCRETDDFAGVMKTLIQVLETDLDYVHMHTRLLQRAREWDNNKRNPSFTLRGTDLRVAEAWLEDGAEKKPSPTPLQTQYIAASRKLAVASQRPPLTLRLIWLVVTLVPA